MLTCACGKVQAGSVLFPLRGCSAIPKGDDVDGESNSRPHCHYHKGCCAVPYGDDDANRWAAM
jgi:hypothetical protein